MNEADLAVWADTALGLPTRLNPALRVAAGICLAYPTPCALVWGEEYLMFYNDAYAALLGDRHPAARGRSAWDVVPDMWCTIGPILSEVATTGRGFSAQGQPLPLTTGAGRRARWYSYLYVPVHDPDVSRVVGVLAAVTDVTSARLSDQRSAALDMLHRSEPPTAATLRPWSARVVGTLSGLDAVRFAALYALDESRDVVTRLAGPRDRSRPGVALRVAEAAGGSPAWPVGRVLRDGDAAPVRLPTRPARSDARPLHDGAWLIPFTGPPGVRMLLTVGFDDDLLDDAAQRQTVDQVVAALVRD